MGSAEEKNKITGITDLPCSDEKTDLLNISKYVDGLQKFIENCPTPMSIAIQGDWGTGKTSTINMLQNRLEAKEEKNIKCVYFNTWQYSQFNMSDNLYMSFVNSLVKKCCSKKDVAGEIKTYAQKACTKLVSGLIKDNIGLDMEELFKKQEEQMESVEKLKDAFSNMVKNEVDAQEDGRIVVFIDDLDRLNPEVAVELLEVIKLFMDVERCIFVLAIDYDRLLFCTSERKAN